MWPESAAMRRSLVILIKATQCSVLTTADYAHFQKVEDDMYYKVSYILVSQFSFSSPAQVIII